LLQEGYIQIKRRPLSRLKLLFWKLGWGPHAFLTTFLKKPANWPLVRGWVTRAQGSKTNHNLLAEFQRVGEKLFLSLEDIDWSRTKAYCQTGPGLIRINLQGREPQGTVAPEAYQSVCEELVRKLRALVDPGTGRTIQAKVVLRDEVYHGSHLDLMPDIVYMAFDDRYLAGNPVTFGSNKIIVDGLFPSGFHRMEGMFLAKGPVFQRGVTLQKATIFDLAPTILYLMGTEIPRDMDGRVLLELFEERFVTAHPIVYGEAIPEGKREAVELSPEDQVAVLDRLKGLGYID
jgi:predicted AlkP superfamily phosphohydrolase/phosphomutase